jgi:hypothetical protein
MWNEQFIDSTRVVSAGFCDIFAAGQVIQVLTQAGFDDTDIEMIGVLAGRLPNLTGLCVDLGVPIEHALYYQTCFEDGGALLLVHTRKLWQQQTATALLRRHGGIFPPVDPL